MRTLGLIAGIIGLLIVGKLYIFPKSDVKEAGGATKGGGGGKGGGPVPVDVFVAQYEAVGSAIVASGTVVPNEEVELKAEISGRLIKLNFREGSVVQKGQLIAKINDRDLKAQLVKIEYNAELARQIEARQKKLLDIDAISREEYEITANNIRTIGADKELILAQLEKTEIRAPFTGIVGLKAISEGAYLAPGTPVVTLIQNNPIKVDFTVPEKYAKSIAVGSVVQLTTEGATTQSRGAKVVALDPRVDENLRTLRVRAVIDNPSGQLVPGMFVKVQTALGAGVPSVMVPTEAVVPVLKGKKVYIVQNGKAVERMIVTGIRTDKTIQVTSGLSVGDSVIVSGIMTLKADAPVKVKKTT